jgi:aminomethyltransferase
MNKTALHDLHVQLGARMVDFAGWSMPLSYTSIVEEHLATRSGSTFFDVSHMGRIYVRGADAGRFLDHVCTRRVSTMEPEQAHYSHICNEAGGILDDVIVSRLSDSFLVVCNASNREKILTWLQRHASNLSVTLEDHTFKTAMIAIQGPAILDRAAELLPFDVGSIRRYRLKAGKYLGIDYICSRTGYTGEDGFEIIVSSAAGRMLSSSLVDVQDLSRSRIRPAGLGARDTLRLEAAMPLYGHELSEQVDSISAGQGWCVNLDRDFIGSVALAEVQKRGPRRRIAGLELEGRRIARQDMRVEEGGRDVGVVTSGTFSPTLQKSIALAFVDVESAAEGTALQVDLRGQRVSARVTALPFYKRTRSAAS